MHNKIILNSHMMFMMWASEAMFGGIWHWVSSLTGCRCFLALLLLLSTMSLPQSLINLKEFFRKGSVEQRSYCFRNRVT